MRQASAELGSHAPVHLQTNVAGRKPIPRSYLLPGELIERVPLRQTPQGAGWRPILRVACNPCFFSLYESQQVCTARPESKLSIEPERARLNGLFVVVSQLIGIHRNGSCAGEMAQAAQDLCEGPRHFAAAKRVEGIEADFDPLKQTDRFDVVDGRSVFEREAGDVSAQRQSALGRQVPQVDGNAATDFGMHYRTRITQGGAIELAIAHQHDFANQVHDRLALGL